MEISNQSPEGRALGFRSWPLPGVRVSRVRRGSMMLLSLVFVALAGMLGAALLSAALASTRLSIHRRDREAAFELAEAGLQHAKLKLDKDRTYTGQGNTVCGGGWYRLEVTPDPANDLRVVVVSTGRVFSGTGSYVERQVRATLGWSRPHSMWKYTILGNQLVDLKERLRVDSSPTPGEAWVHSNALLKLDSVTINGTATAVTSVTTTTNTKVTGAIQSGAATAAFPDLDKAFWMATAEKKGAYTGNLSLNAGTHTLQGKIIGNVTITGSAHVDIKGPLWVTGTLTISGKSWTGNGAVFAQGKILVETSSSIVPGAPDDLAMVSFASDSDAIRVTSRDNSDKITVRGGIFAPNGGIVLGGKVGINGAVIGQTVTGSGTGSSIDVYRSSTYEPPVATSPAVQYWTAL